MNFLAHLYLADRSEDLLVGSFLGDFCKGAVERFPERWQKGIRLHRRVDAFTDDHELPKRSGWRLRPSAGRYAPVVVDVLYDHFLAVEWRRFSDEKLEEASSRYYATLARHRDTFPEVAAWVVGRMASQDWLGSYRAMDGVRTALSRMSGRLRNGFRLESSVGRIEEQYDELRGDFVPFFEEIRVEAERWRSEMTDDR